MCILLIWRLLLVAFTIQMGSAVIEVKVLIKRCNDENSQKPLDDGKKGKHNEEIIITEDDFPGIVRKRLYLHQEFGMDEPEYPFRLTRCQRKLVISLWIKNKILGNVNSTEQDEQLIYIDHGYDDVTSKIVKLLNPVTLRFRQQPVLQAYPFRNIHIVNGLVHEEVINKDETPAFTGCDDTSPTHPTCSYAYKKGKPIPYSQGFCCYCTPSGRPPAHILAEEAQAKLLKETNGHQIEVLETRLLKDNHDNTLMPKVMEIKVDEHAENSDKSDILVADVSPPQSSEIDLQVRQASEDSSKKVDKLTASDLARIMKNVQPIHPAVADSQLQQAQYQITKLDGREALSDVLKDKMHPILPNQQVRQAIQHQVSEIENELAPSEALQEKVKFLQPKFDEPHVREIVLEPADQNVESLLLPKDSELTSVASTEAKRKRRSSSSRVRRQLPSYQQRGGQNCNADSPVDVDPDKYLSSAHCMRLHDIWYTVNAIQLPRLRHSLQLQVYAKKELPDGSQRWSDLNAGSVISLGTDSMHYMQKNQTLVATYSGKALRRENQVIQNVTDKLLLIPQTSGGERARQEHPQLQGPSEYLVVRRALVDLSGRSCDKIGASYSTFALQPNRCERPRGSCLDNQPIQLWERDVQSGGALRLRLGDLGIPESDAVEVNRATGEYLLLMRHTDPYTSYLDVEVAADDIGILRGGLHAQITNVFTKSGERLTLVTVVVTNTGLVSSVFGVQIAACSHKVPDSRRAAASIPPQNQVTFNVTISHGTEIIRDKIVCSALVRNAEDKVVAARRIHAFPHDRCVCVWFCLCACTAERFACTPMSLAHYRSSGFLGSVPSLTKSGLPYIAEIVLNVELLLVTLAVLGLLLGGLKALAGLVFPDSIGVFGLAMCNDKPRTINRYYEPELRHFPVEYDCHGYPVHPLTKTPTVRRMSSGLMFCLNLTWFFYMPLACWYWVRHGRGCLPEACCRCCASPDGSPSRQSLLHSDDGIPVDVSEHRAQSYGGVTEQEITLETYRGSREQLRSGSGTTLGSTISRPAGSPSAPSAASLTRSGTRTSASSMRSPGAVSTSSATRSPGRSSGTSLATSVSGRRPSFSSR